MKVQKNGYLSTWQAAEQYLNQNPKPGQIRTQEGLSFQDILQTKQPDGEVKFSKHAVQRTDGAPAGRDGKSAGKGDQRIPGAGRPAGVYRKHTEQYGGYGHGPAGCGGKHIYKH